MDHNHVFQNLESTFVSQVIVFTFSFLGWFPSVQSAVRTTAPLEKKTTIFVFITNLNFPPFNVRL